MPDPAANHFYSKGCCLHVLTWAKSNFVKRAEHEIIDDLRNDTTIQLLNYASGGGGVADGQNAYLYMLLQDFFDVCNCPECSRWQSECSKLSDDDGEMDEPRRFWFNPPAKKSRTDEESAPGATGTASPHGDHGREVYAGNPSSSAAGPATMVTAAAHGEESVAATGTASPHHGDHGCEVYSHPSASGPVTVDADADATRSPATIVLDDDDDASSWVSVWPLSLNLSEVRAETIHIQLHDVGHDGHDDGPAARVRVHANWHGLATRPRGVFELAPGGLASIRVGLYPAVSRQAVPREAAFEILVQRGALLPSTDETDDPAVLRRFTINARRAHLAL